MLMPVLIALQSKLFFKVLTTLFLSVLCPFSAMSGSSRHCSWYISVCL